MKIIVFKNGEHKAVLEKSLPSYTKDPNYSKTIEPQVMSMLELEPGDTFQDNDDKILKVIRTFISSDIEWLVVKDQKSGEVYNIPFEDVDVEVDRPDKTPNIFKENFTVFLNAEEYVRLIEGKEVTSCQFLTDKYKVTINIKLKPKIEIKDIQKEFKNLDFDLGGPTLKKGDESTLVAITCPHCGARETYEPSAGEQPEKFDVLEPSEDGLTHYYKCQSCGKKFYTIIA